MTSQRRVGFQGVAGAFSEQALLAAVESPVRVLGFRAAPEVGQAIESGLVDYGFLPLENTLAGAVAPTLDILANRRLRVVAEVVMPIRQCLLGFPGAEIEGLREVESHPVALMQCTRFLAEHPTIRATAGFDTAGAAARVADIGDVSRGAIASRACADLYGLDLLAEGIDDRPDNTTRFVFLADGSRGGSFDLVNAPPSRALIHALVPREPRALARLLEAIRDGGYDLTTIEARPVADPRLSQFFLELEAPELNGSSLRLLGRARDLGDIHLLGAFSRVAVDG